MSNIRDGNGESLVWFLFQSNYPLDIDKYSCGNEHVLHGLQWSLMSEQQAFWRLCLYIGAKIGRLHLTTLDH